MSEPYTQLRSNFHGTFFQEGGDDIFGISARFKEYSNLLESHVNNNTENVCFIKEATFHHNQEYTYIKDFQKYSIKGMYDHILYAPNVSCYLRNCSNIVFFGEAKYVDRIIDTIRCYMEKDDNECSNILYKNRSIGHTFEAYVAIVEKLKLMSECKYHIQQFNSTVDDLVLVKFYKKD